MDAERTKDYPAALQYNYDFHFGVYRRSDMPQLIEILERLWVQVGPMLSFLYPDASPQYDGVHQHLNVIKALKRKNEVAVRKAFEQDLIEGGRNFIRHLSEIEAKEAGNHHSFSKKNPKP